MCRFKLNICLLAILVPVMLTVGVDCKAEDHLPNGIAFFAEHEGGLHVLDPSTGSIQRLEVSFHDVTQFAYSHSSRALTFQASTRHDQPPSLYLIESGASSAKRIFKASRDAFLMRPKFDPSGRYVYAVSYDLGIRRYDTRDEQWEEVGVSGVESLTPQGLAFSPSGNRVAISPGRFEEFLIGVVDDSGIVITDSILREFSGCTSPRWVSESQIVFAGRQEAGVQHLWSIDLNTRQVRQITHDPIATRDFLDLSPNRQEIVFTATDGQKSLEWRLWQVNVDGSQLRQLTQGGELSSHLGPIYLHQAIE